MEQNALLQLTRTQRAIFHDPARQPSTSDPDRLLALGYGRCGEISIVLSHLLDKIGIENRIVKMLKHIVVEARWDGRWHLLDADLFKHGVIPRKDNGEIPSLREVQGNYLMDRFPPTAYVYTRDYRLYKDVPCHLLHPPHFHEPHEAGFMSHYYQMNLGLPLEYPPSRPTDLTSKIMERKILLSWSPSQDADNDLVGYEVLVNTVSRGWNYEDPDYDNVPRDTSDKPIFTEHNEIEVTLDSGTYYWSVKAIDEHREKEPRTYYFPSDECSLKVV